MRPEKPTPKAKFRALGQLFTYLATGEDEVRLRAKVNDLSCTTSDCHQGEIPHRRIRKISSQRRLIIKRHINWNIKAFFFLSFTKHMRKRQ